MEDQEIINGIILGTRGSKESASYGTIYESSLEKSARNEFLFFIKPEVILLKDENKKRRILEMVLRKFSQFGFTIEDIRILGAEYLEKYDIIARHYGVINALSRDPLAVFSAEAANKFRQVYGIDTGHAPILGSLQFLKEFPSHTPESLQQLWQSSSTTKLAGGTYCARIMSGNREIFLINGFHPKQLVHFTSKGRSIVTFRLKGEVSWQVARNEFIGKTNPADAQSGSLRNELLKQKETFGLSDVSAGQNGFHLSAGPVEGLVELMRYCSDFSTAAIKKPADFSFGRILEKHFSAEVIDRICGNSNVNFQGNVIGTFDLTEEKDSEDAILLLRESKI